TPAGGIAQAIAPGGYLVLENDAALRPAGAAAGTFFPVPELDQMLANETELVLLGTRTGLAPTAVAAPALDAYDEANLHDLVPYDQFDATALRTTHGLDDALALINIRIRYH